MACSSEKTAVAVSKLFRHVRMLSFGVGGTIANGGIKVIDVAILFPYILF
jgi:hypothetical protein